MKQILMLPTWIIARAVIPFLPKSHVWKDKRFTLKNWTDNSLPLTKTFSLCFWICFIEITILVLQILLF